MSDSKDLVDSPVAIESDTVSDKKDISFRDALELRRMLNYSEFVRAENEKLKSQVLLLEARLNAIFKDGSAVGLLEAQEACEEIVPVLGYGYSRKTQIVEAAERCIVAIKSLCQEKK